MVWLKKFKSFALNVHDGMLWSRHQNCTMLASLASISTAIFRRIHLDLEYVLAKQATSASACLVLADSVEHEIKSIECKSVLHAATWLLRNLLPLIGIIANAAFSLNAPTFWARGPRIWTYSTRPVFSMRRCGLGTRLCLILVWLLQLMIHRM